MLAVFIMNIENYKYAKATFWCASQLFNRYEEYIIIRVVFLEKLES